MLTHDNVFVTPPFDGILDGITIQTLMQLIPKASPLWWDLVVGDTSGGCAMHPA